MSDETPAPNGAPPAPDPDNVWVQLDTLKDPAIEEVHEDDDIMLVVGDIDIEPNYQFIKPPVVREQDETESRETIYKRIISHQRQKPYMYCDHCDYKTRKRNRGSLITHIRTHHMKTTIINCNFCTFSTKTTYSMKKHIKLQHRMFKCRECTYKTFIKRNFNQHKSSHIQSRKLALKEYQKLKRRPEKLQCATCPYVTLIKRKLIWHLRTNHKEIAKRDAVKCEYCQYITKGDYQLKLHTDKSLRENLIQCDQCDFESYYMCEYRLHRKSHPYKCVINKKIVETDEDKYTEDYVIVNLQKFPRTPNSITTKYDTTKKFLINMQCMIDIKNILINSYATGAGKGKKGSMYCCGQCTFKSTKKDSVKWHVHRQHTDNSVKPFLCINCDFTSKTQDAMRKHVKKSAPTKLLQCKHCQFKSKFRCQMKMHNRQHNPYYCEMCECRFNFECQLRKHFKEMHTHSIYKCELCDFSTMRKDKMIKHESTHTGEKPWRCSECDFACVNKVKFYTHMSKSHPKRSRNY